MAWNHYYIFVKGPTFNDLGLVLGKLGLGAYQPSAAASLDQANKPTTLFAGIHQGNLLLVHQELVLKFFGPEQSEEERVFVDAFPEAEIAAIIINESVGLFGFAVINQGKKIRMKDGCDGEYYNDEGILLPEEAEVLAEEIFLPEELEEMREEGMDEEEIDATVRFEASYRVPNRITRRYLGAAVLQVDTSDVKLMRYELA